MKQKMLGANYRRIFTWVLILALALAIATAVGVPLSLRTQIQEARTLRQEAQTQAAQLPDTADGHAQREELEDVWKGQLTPVSTGNIAFYCVLGALWALLLLFYWLAVAAWLYHAAAAAGMHPTLWPILGLAGNFLAVAAFLIVRDRPARQRGAA